MRINLARASWLLVVILLAGLSGCLQHGVEIHGEGATFPAPIYARWIALFNREHDSIHVHYHAVGSSAGIRAITSRTAQFGASDALLNEFQLKELKEPLLSIPTVMGPIVMAYNLPGVDSELTLSGDVIADIYLGKITHWNDDRLQSINHGIELPDTEIHVAHRSDGSGTSYIFTDYLSAVSEEWEANVGRGQRVHWPTGDEWAGAGNDGVAHRILLLPGGVGYLELKYAQNAGLKYAALINKAGNTVRPTVGSVQEAELNTPAVSGSVIKPSIVHADGKSSYPICGYTYLLVYQDLTYLNDPAMEQGLITFLKWTLTKGQQHAPDLHYTPLPEELRVAALGMVDSIVYTQGHDHDE